jgi:hypothetical protein
MTMTAAFLGLVPIIWATGTGSDVMKHIAAPMIRGILTSFLLAFDFEIPFPYLVHRWINLQRRPAPITYSSYLKQKQRSCNHPTPESGWGTPISGAVIMS